MAQSVENKPLKSAATDEISESLSRTPEKAYLRNSCPRCLIGSLRQMPQKHEVTEVWGWASRLSASLWNYMAALSARKVRVWAKAARLLLCFQSPTSQLILTGRTKSPFTGI